MSQYKELNSLQKSNNYNSKSFLLKNIASTMQLANKLDLQRILDFLNTTVDIDKQVKLFSTLSAYLISNNFEIDLIIKSNAVYSKLHDVLANGPRKATEALNFLSALLYIGDEGSSKRKTLALYARNMTRVSGCLAAMSDMFSNCMMYHDTWKALCQCLAVACSGSKANQSYCTHLVPVCIKRCNQSNIDMFLVLQSLLYDHHCNVQLFLDTDGPSLFNRELLHYDKCLQLLATVVQSTTPAALQITCNTNVSEHLQDFVLLYGPQSQIGQKAKIILNHMESRVEGRCKKATIIASENVHKTFSAPINPDKQTDLDNLDATTHLMQNVMSEILNWNHYKDVTYKKCSISAKSTKANSHKTIVAENKVKDEMRQQDKGEQFSERYRDRKSKVLQSDMTKELSFSFLKNQHFWKRDKNYNCGQERRFQTINRNGITNKEIGTIRNVTMRTDVNHQMETTETFKNVAENLEEDPPNRTDLNKFQPVFASTPKKNTKKDNRICSSQPHLYKSSYMASRRHCKRQGIYKLKRNQDQQPREIKHRSISTRFIEAINESCTTFVNTVKSIFKSKKNNTQLSKEDTRSSQITHFENAPPCSYSFTKYMRKRDAVLRNEWIKQDDIDCEDFTIEFNSCNTCNDTIFLKRKLSNDKNLKQTVKKLKLGINLYGCDFKKISKTMWPRDDYMTPVILYNLYRKLIAK